MLPSRRAGKPASSATTVVHALSRTFKRLSIRHQVESGAPFNADINLRIDIVIEREASEREASETLRRQCTATRRYSSTSCTQTPKRGSTCGMAALIETDQLPTLLRCESAITTLV